MLDLSKGSHNRAFSVALDNFRVTAKCFHQLPRHFQSQRFQVIHKPFDVRDVRAGKRISDDRNGRRAAQWRFGYRTSVVKDFFHSNNFLSDHYLRHVPILSPEPESQSFVILPKFRPRESLLAGSALSIGSAPFSATAPQFSRPLQERDLLPLPLSLEPPASPVDRRDRYPEPTRTPEPERWRDASASQPHWQ